MRIDRLLGVDPDEEGPDEAKPDSAS